MKWLILIPLFCFVFNQGYSQNPKDGLSTSSSASLSTKLSIRNHILKGDSALSKGDLPSFK